MPCNSDYLNASPIEKAASAVECLIDELDGVPVDEGWRRGYHPRAYNQTDKLKLDARVKELCGRLSPLPPQEIVKYSLELQIWWRDHQRADRIRQETEAQKIRRAFLREHALSKLSDEELDALGLKP